jgi:hypothetical protein
MDSSENDKSNSGIRMQTCVVNVILLEQFLPCVILLNEIFLNLSLLNVTLLDVNVLNDIFFNVTLLNAILLNLFSFSIFLSFECTFDDCHFWGSVECHLEGVILVSIILLIVILQKSCYAECH